MKKNANRKHARLQSIDAAQLAQVTGGNAYVSANWNFHNLSTDWGEGTGWGEFFGAAATAVSSCTCGA